MTPQQHLKTIRKIARKRGVDPFIALRTAKAASLLLETTGEDTTVIWPEYAGGLAWEALEAPEPAAPDTIHVVFPPEGPADRALWKRLSGRMTDRSIRLETTILDQWPGRQVDGSVDSGSTAAEGDRDSDRNERTAVRILRKLLDRLTAAYAVEMDATPATAAVADSRAAVLADPGTIDPKSRLSTSTADNSCLNGAESGDDFFHLDSRTPLDERITAAGALMAAGCIPVVPLGSEEAPRSTVQVEILSKSGRPFILLLDSPLKGLAGFSVLESLVQLSPANTEDALSALEWVRDSGSCAVVLEPGSTAHPPKAVFRQPWKDGQGIVVRESRKGSAGHILLTSPGKNIASAVKAADRLIRDNISVTVLSQRFLSGFDPGLPDELGSESDVVVVAEESTFNGDLRSRIARCYVGTGRIHLLMAPDGAAPAELAELAARELREKRIRRTVDDVKADRWR